MINELYFIISLLIKKKLRENFFILMLFVLIIFSVVLMISTKIFIGVKYKVFIDTGIFLVNFIMLIFTILISSELITGLKKTKFLQWLYSLPLLRVNIFIGNFFTFFLLLFFIFFILSIDFFIISKILKVGLFFNIAGYFFLNFLKFILLGTVGLIFSINYSMYSVVLIEITIYIIGVSTLNLLKYFSGLGKISFFFAKIIYYIFPDLTIPYFTAKISHSFFNNDFILLKSICYYFFYTLIILITGCLWIEKREII